MEKQQTSPILLKNTKRKIRVDYEGKASAGTRVRLKLTTPSFWVEKLWYLARFIIMLGISYVILQPFFSRIFQSFMTFDDFIDPTVGLIPKHWSGDMYRYITVENHYFTAMRNTFFLSLICAVIQTFICCMVGYGLSKFKFRGRKLIFAFVILMLVIPPDTLRLAIKQHFDFFDFFSLLSLDNKGIIELITGRAINMNVTFAPFIILSLIGCGFKNSLYIFMMMQFFKGVPDELEESAYVDGSGAFRTFIQIILPLSIPMMITIFLFSFSWQWTDELYVGIFMKADRSPVMLASTRFWNVIPASLKVNRAGKELFDNAIKNTAAMMVIAPLILVYLFGQRYLVQGIERSGIVG